MDSIRSVAWRDWLLLAARLVTGVVWLVAGGAKLTELDQSARAVRAYELLPWQVADAVGHVLPAVEVVVGAALVVGVLTRVAGVMSALLFVAFIVGIASAWARGLTIDCGCFGGGGYDPDAASKYPGEIARDVGLLALSCLTVWLGGGRFALDRWLFGRPGREDDMTNDEGLELDRW